MTTIDADSMHRLAKTALDSGEVSSPEEALQLFSRYRLRIHLGAGWADTIAGQACFLTALNTSARAFLGGVEVYGDLSPVLRVPLYGGREARSVVEELGGSAAKNQCSSSPTLVLGRWPEIEPPEFCVSLSWDAWCASVAPVDVGPSLTCAVDNALAAALGVNEAFLHVRGDLLDAGHRTVGLSL